MQLKSFYIRDANQDPVAGASAWLYLPDTTTDVTGIEDKDGNSITNPMTSESDGLLQLSAPNGSYDLKVQTLSGDYTLRVQFLDNSVQYDAISNLIPHAMCNLVPGTGFMANHGFSSYVKNSAGDFNFVLNESMGDTNPIPDASCVYSNDPPGFTIVEAVSDTELNVQTYNWSGDKADPDVLYITIYAPNKE